VKSRLLTITLAAVLALVGIVAVLAYVHQANERAVNGLKAETVMVAAGPIGEGTSLSKAQQEHLLSTEKVPESSLTTPAVQSVTAANGQLVMSGAVAKGQVLLQNMLTSATSPGTAGSFVVPAGMVAVTVNMCVAEAVADYVTPGSDVAVFDTIAGNGSQVQRSCDLQHQIVNSSYFTNGGAATLLVLKQAEVLAVGQNPRSQTTSGSSNGTVATDPSASSSSTSQGELLVTLAVDQADAERLILINEVGMPYMALLGSSSNTGFAGPVQVFQEQP